MQVYATPAPGAALALEAVAEARAALSKLDDRLCEALARGDIRFLRTAWLKSQPEGYRLQYRQELETLEAKGESPLLSETEADGVVRRGDRSGGAVTYGWLCPGASRQRTPRHIHTQPAEHTYARRSLPPMQVTLTPRASASRW